MILTGIVRLGRDCEVSYANDGTPVANFSGAYNFGRKVEGERPTQWIELALWGDRADKLSQYLTKGKAVSIVAIDVHVETYRKRDESEGWKFKGRVLELEFAGGGEDRASAPSAPARTAAPRPEPARAGYGTSPPPSRPVAPPPKQSTAFDDMEDDIPF